MQDHHGKLPLEAKEYDELFLTELEAAIRDRYPGTGKKRNADLLIEIAETFKLASVALGAINNNLDMDAQRLDIDADEDHLRDIYTAREQVVSALFTGLYGVVELQLLRIAKRAGDSRKVQVSDFRGAGIQRSAQYLEKVVGINVKRIEHWRFIDNARMIRNVIAHCNGSIDDSSSAVEILAKHAESEFYRIEDDYVVVREEAIKALAFNGMGLLASIILQLE